MIAVVTGDIIHSRKTDSSIWLPSLKKFLTANIGNKKAWEIYRGDSFQFETNPANSLHLVLCIKALMKSINGLDVRMAIGIGEKSYQGKKVTESNGTAYINSGESFEQLKNTTLHIKTPSADFDEIFQPILRMTSLVADNWKPATANTIYRALLQPDLLQKDLAEQLEKDSTTISKALKRGGYEELRGILDLYTKRIEHV